MRTSKNSLAEQGITRNVENGSLERHKAVEKGAVHANGNGGQASTSERVMGEESGFNFASQIYSGLQSVYESKRTPLFLHKCSEQYRVDKRVRGALGLPKNGVRASEKGETLSLKVTLNFRTDADIDEKGLTVFCVVGQTTDKLSIEPLRVALIQAEFGKPVQVELSFPEGKPLLSRKSGVKTGEEDAAGTNSGEAQTTHSSGKSDYVLMLIIWNEHKDTSFLFRNGNGNGSPSSSSEVDSLGSTRVRFVTRRSSREKIFTLIPTNSEVLWHVMPLGQALPKVSKDWEGESLKISNPISNANIRFERARLNLDIEHTNEYEFEGEVEGEIDHHRMYRLDRKRRNRTDWNRICLWQTKIPDSVPYTAMITQSEVSLAVKANGDELNLPELWFEYKHYKNGRRKAPQTERYQAFSSPSCAFCSFKVGSGVCLMEHLKSSHGLFNFEPEWTSKHNYCIKVLPPKRGEFSRSKATLYTYNKMFSHVPSRSERLERLRNFENSVFDEYVNRLSETKDSSVDWLGNGHLAQEVVRANTNGRTRRDRKSSKLHKRNGGPEPTKKIRATASSSFYHSRTGIRMTEKEIHGDVDSDDDFEQNYLLQQSKINKCHWVTAQQKKFMNTWNLFITRQPPPIADKMMSNLCSKFVKEFLVQDDSGFKDCFIVHVMQLWHHGVLTRKEARTLIDPIERARKK